MAYFDAYSGYGGAPAPTGAVPTAHIPKLPDGGYGGAPWQDGPFVKFKNFQPRSRNSRRLAMDKDTIEKSRLRERTGGFAKYQDPGALISAADPSSAGYMAPSDQFVTDVAAEEKLRRQAEAAKRAHTLLRRREATAARDDARWESMERARTEEAERIAKLRENATKSAANKRSMAYDPLTLKYEDSEAGKALQRADEQVMYRAALRAHRLQSKAHGADYNLLTGSQQDHTVNPMLPKVDAAVQRQFNATGTVNAYLGPPELAAQGGGS